MGAFGELQILENEAVINRNDTQLKQFQINVNWRNKYDEKIYDKLNQKAIDAILKSKLIISESFYQKLKTNKVLIEIFILIKTIGKKGITISELLEFGFKKTSVKIAINKLFKLGILNRKKYENSKVLKLQKYVTKGKDAATIISQARLTYLLETNSSETLKSFSNALGEKIIQRETRSTNGNNETVSTSEQKETLISLSEIKYKDPDMTIISSGGSKPMALKLKPAYEYLTYDSYIHKPKIIKLDTKLGWDFKNMRLIEFEQYKPNNNQKILEELLANISKLNKNYCIDFKNEVIKKN
ncbi:MAGa4850 family ICE element protein [Metamycoplasma equirhinis]|uniref:MAGa4850 family ICE element protein n=1 Tax=Metamycoplasma equirhinis TaxID=92402 RepID=UPI00359C4641